MRKPRKPVFGVLALLLAGALALPAGSALAASDGSGAPTAVAAKKKCKKGFVRKTVRKKQTCVKAKKCKKGHVRKIVRKKQTCVRKKRSGPTGTTPATGPGTTTPQTPAAPAWSDGRWGGNYVENGAVELLFNVAGGQLYTGGFDSFFIQATCSGGAPDPSAIAPVQAAIAPNGDFSGSGVYSPGFGLQLPWKLSGHISGKSITGGTFTVGPYTNTYGDSCGGTVHFTGQWIGAYTF